MSANTGEDLFLRTRLARALQRQAITKAGAGVCHVCAERDHARGAPA